MLKFPHTDTQQKEFSHEKHNIRYQIRGYSRSVTALYRCLKRLNLQVTKLPNPEYVPKSYKKALFPGEKVQVDVRHVPSACIVGDAAGQKMYQYTAIDECTGFRYIAAFQEANTYSSTVFIKQLRKRFKFQIHCVQTDNGFEFTNRFGNTKGDNKTLQSSHLIYL